MTDVETMVAKFLTEQADLKPADRWRKPVRPVVVEASAGEVRVDGDTVRGGYNATFDQETIDRFRAGRACLKCWEPLQEAFPKVCPLPGCGYRIRDNQARDLDHGHEGKKWIGPSTPLEDEYARMK